MIRLNIIRENADSRESPFQDPDHSLPDAANADNTNGEAVETAAEKTLPFFRVHQPIRTHSWERIRTPRWSIRLAFLDGALAESKPKRPCWGSRVRCWFPRSWDSNFMENYRKARPRRTWC